ncbi:VgrG-related protein [Streptomyces vinaceus]|uniref:VgrG-related protein n=1 Tax=Streptomyces vinaceus TaxID=1960 RepID=UPI00381A3833
MNATDAVRPTVEALVRAGRFTAAALPEPIQNMVRRVIVDTHLRLPDMFEISFEENCTGEGETVSDHSGFQIGSVVEIYGGAPGAPAQMLISAEVTSVEAICENNIVFVVVRGYDQSHRLQRVRRTRSFTGLTDSQIVKEIVSEAKVNSSRITPTLVQYDHLSQINQTDWDFLQERARLIGFEAGFSRGGFYFRKAGRAVGLVDPPAASLPELEFTDNLISFRPRITSASLTPRVEVRSWDPSASRTTVARDTDSGYASPAEDPGALLKKFVTKVTAPKAKVDQSPPPDPGAQVVLKPTSSGTAPAAEAALLARGAAERLSGHRAEAEGYAVGDTRICAGEQVNITRVPGAFAGVWTVTHARHVFDDEEGGYHTRFTVGGGRDRTLLGLTSGGRTAAPAPERQLVCGIVSNVNDPTDQGRVKVKLPWLDPGYESDWARVVQFGAGPRGGALFVPDVDDEVLVGFELADPGRPLVVGSLRNASTPYRLADGDHVKKSGNSASVVRRGYASPSGNQLVFTDEIPGKNGKPTVSQVTLGTAGNDICLAIDQKARTLTLACKAAAGKESTISITCGDKGVVNLSAGDQGTVNVTSGGSLKLKAVNDLALTSQGSLSITASRTVSISGASIKLN